MSDPVLIALFTVTVPSLIFQVLAYLNGRKIHTLVNSQYGDSLWIGMVSARNLAASRPTEENKLLADVAAQKYYDHQAKQSRVDDGKKD